MSGPPWWLAEADGEFTSWLPGDLAEAIAQALEARRVRPDDAAVTATHLVEGSVRGYASHGVERLAQIVAMLDHGSLCAQAVPTSAIVADGIAVVDAGWSLGPPAAAFAVRQARQRARSAGVGIVALHNAGHLGILAPWAEQVADADSFGLIISSSEPGVVAPGGTDLVFGTNPIAFAWPGASSGAADFSTAAISRSQMLTSAQDGTPLPERSAVNDLGHPTTDARLAVNGGGILPIGAGFKGALISLLAGLLAGPVVGGPGPIGVRGTRRVDTPPRRSDFFLCLNLEALTDMAHFDQEVSALFAALQSSDFRIPGSQREARTRLAGEKGVQVSARINALLRR